MYVRRPLFYLAISLATPVFVLHYFGLISGLISFLAVSLIAVSMYCKGSKDRNNAFIILFLLVYLTSFINCAGSVKDTELIDFAKAGREVKLSGVAEEVKIRDNHISIVLNPLDDSYAWKPFNKDKVMVSCYDESEIGSVIPGQVISVTGKPELPQTKRNPNCFDYRLYLQTKGIRTVMVTSYIDDSRDVKLGRIAYCVNSFRGKCYLVRESFLNYISDSGKTRTAELMRAIMFGDKSELDEETQEVFQKNGTAHILAVSGLHIGIIYGVIAALWRRKKGKLYLLSVSIMLWTYAVMADFSPSVVRAVLMIMLHMIAQIYGKKYDMNCAAYLTSIIMLVINPMKLFHTGFQMSFLAVLSLAALIPYIKKIHQGALLSGLAIQIGLGPYIVYNFNYLSIITILINLPIVFLTGIILPVGLLGLIGSMAGIESGIIVEIITFLTNILVWINDVFELDGITTFQVASPNKVFIIQYYVAMVSLASEAGRMLVIKRKKVLLKRILIIGIAISIAFTSYLSDGFSKSDLVFIDVGQGDSMHLKVDRGPLRKSANYLIDGGGNINYNLGKKTLKTYLLKNGVSHIDGAFVTHLHTDHYKGIVELCQEGMVDRLYVYEANRYKEAQILTETGLSKSQITYVYAGELLNLSKGYSIEILWPNRKSNSEYSSMISDEDNENDMSLVLKVNIEGVSTLVTGDIDSKLMDELASMYNEECTVIKVPHHGSKYSISDALISSLKPELAVIQVGKNNYGHPANETLEYYKDAGVRTMRNDENGAIGLIVSGNRWETVSIM